MLRRGETDWLIDELLTSQTPVYDNEAGYTHIPLGFFFPPCFIIIVD